MKQINQTEGADKKNINLKDSGPRGLNLSAIYVLLSGVLWGFMGLLVRTLNAEGLSSMEITFVRALVTFAVMLIGLLVFDRKALKIKVKDIWCFIGTGAFSVAFFNFCYFKTMTLTSLSVAAVLLYTAPAFVMEPWAEESRFRQQVFFMDLAQASDMRYIVFSADMH